ncbi:MULTISPECIES: helix-turn-helix domain-containing protein [unclassified Bradyrhizobium]|uniref:helix-turn-helix domain-containing protein n=1 Tax=unclassified Bradyrhizobium TaxID=2631580 RepID=UPI0033947E35
MKITDTTQPTTFLERDNWLRAVLASDLPHVAVRVGAAVALHLHVKTGRCDPSFAGIATDTGMSERSIYRLVALLEHRGWLTTQRTGGRFRNQYILRNPDKVASGFNHDTTPSGFDDTNPDTAPSGSTLTESTSNPDTTVADKKRRTTKKERRGKSQTQAPLFASLDSGEDARSNPDRKTGVKNTGLDRTIQKASADESGLYNPKTAGDPDADQKIASYDANSNFPDFWSAYPKRVAKAQAEKAFAAAIKRSADPAAMIDGAKRYAAERAGQDPKFTKHPATWLNGECWLDESFSHDDGKTIDQHGNIIDTPRPRRRSQEEIDAEAEAQILAENAHWSSRR